MTKLMIRSLIDSLRNDGNVKWADYTADVIEQYNIVRVQ